MRKDDGFGDADIVSHCQLRQGETQSAACREQRVWLHVE